MPSHLENKPIPAKNWNKYTPPSKRPIIPDTIDLSDRSFPSLSKSQMISSLTVKTNMSEIIKNIREKEEVIKQEQLKNPELDHKKMTREQLYANGWDILPLTGKFSSKTDQSY